MNTRPFLISRLKEEWNNLDPVDPLRGLLSDAIDALTEQPAQQQEPIRVPVTDNTYGYAKSLAEAIFKQHFASDEHYASGRIVWGVNDTVIGILTQIDNMVADMVRRPAQQQEPVAWMKDCADFWEHYTYISEASQENYKAEAQMWVEKLRKSPQPSKPWVGLTQEDMYEIGEFKNTHGYVPTGFKRLAAAIEAKLREKNS